MINVFCEVGNGLLLLLLVIVKSCSLLRYNTFTICLYVEKMFKARVYGRSLAGIASSNPAVGMGICLL